MAATTRLANLSTATGMAASRNTFLGTPFDHIGAEEALELLRGRKARDAFAYVVTPNVDHVVRLAERPELRRCYDRAWMSWCDSRPVAALARLAGRPLPHFTGADAVARIFAEVLVPGDRISCIAADAELLDTLHQRYPQFDIAGHVPPHGFEDDAAAFADCLDFIARTPARFHFIGVGAPRSERLALAVRDRGHAHGTVLCIGAGLEFIAGRKARAPSALRRAGFEWLHRLASEPRRLWRRYLFAVVPLARLFAEEMLARRGSRA